MIPAATNHATTDDALAQRFQHTRARTDRLCEPLAAEDMTVQACEETSPAKWHLAHTTWFFETFVLEKHDPSFAPYNPDFRVLFNSYYHTLGERHPRPARGMLTRPGLGEVMAYRDTVNERVVTLLASLDDEQLERVTPLVELGLQHEQQHQELLLMDIKRLLSLNPTRPAYAPAVRDEAPRASQSSAPDPTWIDIDGGVRPIGHHPGDAFAFDNETPRHRTLLEPFQLRSHPVTNAEFAAFINDGGYKRPELWLDEGWSTVCRERWEAPLYWSRAADSSWHEYTLFGERPLDPHAPAVHISFFEAEAFARWADARLPTEAEWEAAAAGRWDDAVAIGHFLDDDHFHPRPTSDPSAPNAPVQLAGSVWEWTRSSHEPYPGYRPPAGPVGEYNGKFMCNSFVLRGGSCVTPRDHIRPTYRNFFRPGARWAFAGLRLARGGNPSTATEIHATVKRANLRRTLRRADPASENTFESDALAALSQPAGSKRFAPRHLYDAAGSKLFERIVRLDEYTLARTESDLLAEIGHAIAEAVGPDAVLIEPGSGDGRKAEILLRPLRSPHMFIPIEISAAALKASTERIAAAFPDVIVKPVNAPFHAGLVALQRTPQANRVLFFPGSTIGNMDGADRTRLLTAFAEAIGPDGHALIGFDMVKDQHAMVAAYDDAEGVSAAFAKNLITRLNRELNAGLDPDAFTYQARWSQPESRIEMSLRCDRPQRATIAGRAFVIQPGEHITTEYSYKFTPEQIRRESSEASLSVTRTWSDHDDSVTLALLAPANPSTEG